MNSIESNFIEARSILDEFIKTKENFVKIKEAGDIMVKALKNNKKIISCGNGGSMCDAMHLAEELTGKFRNDRAPLAALAISDASYLSCSANDYGFEYSFSRFVEALAQPGDVFVAISTSGNSKNIVEATLSAKKKQMWVIGLTGKDGGELSSMCDIEIRAPYSKYADRAQEIHIKVIHSLIHYIERHVFL